MTVVEMVEMMVAEKAAKGTLKVEMRVEMRVVYSAIERAEMTACGWAAWTADWWGLPGAGKKAEKMVAWKAERMVASKADN